MDTFYVSEDNPNNGSLPYFPNFDMWHKKRNPSCPFDLAHIKGIIFEELGESGGVSGTEKTTQEGNSTRVDSSSGGNILLHSPSFLFFHYC